MKLAALLFAPLAASVVPGIAAAQAPDPDRRLVKQVTVKAPVADVWKAWTTTEGIVSFFAPSARVEARPGGPFEIHFNPYARPGLKGADDMVVLAVQEEKMISFTWNSPPQMPVVRPQRTAVQVRFRPTGDKETEVRLVHGGWGEGEKWDESFKYFDTAWGRILANLQKRFVEGPVDWTEYRARVKAYQDAEDAKAAAAGKP